MKVFCPYCNKEVEYRIDKRKISKFKNVEIDTYEEVGVCSLCDKDLYVNELEIKNDKRIYDLYRKKAKLIAPQDIVKFREKYKISQRELTQILGMGKMTINRYENGAVPTKSQSDYLKMLIENEEEFIKLVDKAYKNNNISEKTFSKINNLEIKSDFNDKIKNRLIEKLDRNPDIYNGYKSFDFNKLENIISYIASRVNNLTQSTLNNYLWYIDMLFFKLNCVSITGLSYEHDKVGPTIIDRLYQIIAVMDSKYKQDFYEDDITTLYIRSDEVGYIKYLDNDELEVIDKVINKFKNKGINEILEISCKEKGFKETKLSEKISFNYAMEMKEF